MELLYENIHGTIHGIDFAPNLACELQLVVGNVGLFFSRADLEHLPGIVKDSYEPCFCEERKGTHCKNSWSRNPLIHIRPKIDGAKPEKLEKRIEGIRFMLHMADTLKENRWIPKEN